MSEIKLIIQWDAEEAEAAEVLVDGTIGDHPYRFLLDTGATHTHLQLDDYTATFESVEKSHSSGVFTAISDDVITVPNLTVGPILRQNFSVVRTTQKESDVRNLIGMNLLKDFRCHFLFDENRILLDEEAQVEMDYPFQALFLDKGFHAYVDVEFGPHQAPAVWDTGASITVVDLNLIESQRAFFEEVGQSSGTDASGSKVETPMFMMAATTIGGQVFGPHRVAGVDLSRVNATIETPMSLILGYSTLSKANWLFDFPGRQWTITKMISKG